jgi:type II secretory pathway component PulJ
MKMVAQVRKKEAGFALFDALIALGIFAVMTGLLFQTVSSTAMAKRHVSQSRRAVLIAQSRMAELQGQDSSTALQPGGKDGNFLWRAQVDRFAGSATDNSRGLESISVAVTDAATGRTVVTLNSLRLAD